MFIKNIACHITIMKLYIIITSKQECQQFINMCVRSLSSLERDNKVNNASLYNTLYCMCIYKMYTYIYIFIYIYIYIYTHHQLPFNAKSITVSQPTICDHKPSSSRHSSPSHIPYHNDYSFTPNYSPGLQLNNLHNENSLILMNITSTELNTEFIYTLIKYLNIPTKYITKAAFNNHSAKMYLINSSIVKTFSKDFLLLEKTQNLPL